MMQFISTSNGHGSLRLEISFVSAMILQIVLRNVATQIIHVVLKLLKEQKVSQKEKAAARLRLLLLGWLRTGCKEIFG